MINRSLHSSNHYRVIPGILLLAGTDAGRCRCGYLTPSEETAHSAALQYWTVIERNRPQPMKAYLCIRCFDRLDNVAKPRLCVEGAIPS